MSHAEAVERGRRRAREALALRPPKSPTITVSYRDARAEDGHIWVTLCRGCGWGVRHCRCER